MIYKKLDECLVCGYDDLIEIYDLGIQPLVNNLKDSLDEVELKAPIIVNFCRECSHRQLSIAIDPKLMFSKYLYQTGTSDSHKSFFHDFVKEISRENLNKDRIALDIGCNDGSLMITLCNYDWEVRGIDPSNIENDYDLPVIHDFFPTTKPIEEKFDVITAFNVFAHNDNPFLFLEEMKKILKRDGRIFILTTPARMDNYYHEHISYFTLESMAVLASRCGLQVKSFKEVSMHGKSYLFELYFPDTEIFPHISIVGNNPVIGYGASASGIVLMNYFNFHPDYVIDDNPLKQNKFIPGVNVPIYGSHYLVNENRDLTIIVFAYHLFEEIVSNIKRLRPGKRDIFIHPIKGVIT